MALNRENATQNTLLIIDDVPANIGMLLDFFHSKGFRVLIAEDGGEGLEVARYARPDLILLDIMLPDMDGFEVCRQLKADSDLDTIPVIFMTALNETVDKLKGFELGAADYVTKPLQHEEVLARVNAHLKLQSLQGELRHHAEELEQRNQELEMFSRAVAHDLKSPLNGIIGFGRFLSSLSAGDSLTEENCEDIQWIMHSAEKMVDIIDALLMLAKVGSHLQADIVPEPLDMDSLVANVEERLALELRDSQAQLEKPPQWPCVSAYAPWIEEVWSNYISNAIKYGGEPPQVQLGANSEGDQVRFWVRDNGAGLSREQRARLFTPFTRLHEKGEGHGLGLTIVKRIIEKQGGRVGVEAVPQGGSEFYFCLPKQNAC